MVCLDTSTLLDISAKASRHREAALNLMVEVERRGEILCTTRFNVAELYVGIERSERPEIEAARVAEVLDGLVILEFDDAAATFFGRVKGHLLDIGRPVGDMDILIGAVALAAGHALVTRNARHFADMPGLELLTYTA